MYKSKRYPAALTIAGSDSSGCAGIQADLKTFSAIGVFGTSVITSVTAQNTQEVRAIETLSPEIIRQQAETVLDDITIDTVKTGMLPTPAIIDTVAALIDRYRPATVIADPVMVATSGARLAAASITGAFREMLYPRITLITPNVPEAAALSGVSVRTEDDFHRAAEVLLGQGCRAVLIKGGHLASEVSTDWLFRQDRAPVSFTAPRIDTANLHGTGCTFASAIAACCALGMDLETAVRSAKTYVTSAIRLGSGIRTGRGHGPVNHFFEPKILTSVDYDCLSER
ncbi:MAG: bifunctional hydroxymethylpyrimidine kinase/phosphomethylpyrimidine kinase [Tannerella sp.]|jgi:hydroxymethylpyrimidine/phosphomethylpyrimidine kinase|nr:bifunctional hydroxymethylpyrimidine kinase/phosphomethylpyrimidine kinase [Tannerella sp.]